MLHAGELIRALKDSNHSSFPAKAKKNQSKNLVLVMMLPRSLSQLMQTNVHNALLIPPRVTQQCREDSGLTSVGPAQQTPCRGPQSRA